ncbi:multidrug transporter [Actinoplanes sp. SE50]|uniref:MFS transporter n=1 Tax=unclassified Actinoplanes TaxID=2626549 RepID=UPI00023EC121|nr:MULTISPECIES: MFS transporter [unclassified Actinoplanes]AEV85781.1 Putative multidrug resistance protein mdtD [Actinoplanes sp. SE50/110]ATO84175.1 multidrug transporter [Actinoplanes sp. SE50]SLM01585.1 multidrug transporter [Actinoplanes sp. SE50/110]
MSAAVLEAPADKVHATSLRAVWPAILGLSVVFLVEMLDNSVLNVALPRIARELNASTADLQWITSGYSLLFGGLMMAFGAVADRYGTRRMMLIGLSLFTLANLAVLLVRTPGELIAVRAVVGVTAAMTAPGTMALCFRLFDAENLLMRATSLIATVGLVGMAVGPTVGGLVLQVLPWQTLLVMNVPIAVLALVCIRRGIPADDPAARNSTPLDLPGALFGTATIILALWTATLAVEDGWSQAAPWLAGLGALACAAAFVVRERRTPHPLFDFALIKRPAVGASLAYEAALGLGMAAVSYSASLQLQVVWGWSPAEAALGNLPQVAVMLAIGPFVEKIVDRLTTRIAAPLGAGAVIGGLLIYALLGRYDYVWIAIALALTAAGMRVVATIAGVTVMRGLPEDQTSTGAALSDTSQEVAGSIGMAVIGTIVAAAVSGSLTGVDTSPAAAHTFENAVTVSTLALTAICTMLVVWAARRAAKA